MKNQLYKIIIPLFAYFFCANSLAQSSTITYNIPDWNVSGNLIVEPTPETDPTTKAEYTKLVFKNQNDEIIYELSPSTIDKLIIKIQNIKNKSKSNIDSNRKAIEVGADDEIKRLNELKNFLYDKEKMNRFTEKLTKHKEDGNSVPWFDTIETIRNITLETNGTVE